MAVTAPLPLLVSVEEYLSTTYEPDCEYVDGKLLERQVGERDHSFLQFQIARLLHEKGLLPFTELRVQVAAKRYRIPDVSAERRMPATRFLRTPPYIAIEILSREDRAGEVADKVDDYLAFGVPNIWIVDPRRRHITVYSSSGVRICTEQVETTDGSVAIPLSEIFSGMPAPAAE